MRCRQHEHKWDTTPHARRTPWRKDKCSLPLHTHTYIHIHTYICIYSLFHSFSGQREGPTSIATGFRAVREINQPSGTQNNPSFTRSATQGGEGKTIHSTHSRERISATGWVRFMRSSLGLQVLSVLRGWRRSGRGAGGRQVTRHTQSRYIRIHVHKYAHIFFQKNTSSHAQKYTYTFIHMCTHTYSLLHSKTHTHTNTHMHTYMDMHV